MTEQSALQVACVKKPIGDREREVHVHVHHDPHVVVRGVVAPDRVDQRCIADEPVVAHVTAEVERLVHHVMADHADEHDVAGIRIDQHARDPAEQKSEYRENNQHAPREEHDAEFTHGVDRRVVVGEILVMLPGVAVVDGTQRKHVDQAVHHELVHGPFDEVAANQDRNQKQPLPPRALQLTHAVPDRGNSGAVHHPDVDPAAVVTADRRSILLAKSALPFRHHENLFAAYADG